MSDEEIDFTEAKPVGNVEKIKKFFNTPAVDDPIHDVGNLEYREVCEELLNEYLVVSERLKALEDIKDMLKANIIKTMGREESCQRGGFAVWVHNQERKGDIEWKRLLADGEITEDILEKYRKPATQYKKVEVKKL